MHSLRVVVLLTSVLLPPHHLALLLLVEIELLTDGCLLELQLQLPDCDSGLKVKRKSLLDPQIAAVRTLLAFRKSRSHIYSCS
jgi:hypothetical protein